MSVPKMKREGENGVEVAVLISFGFGAGWSTWNSEVKETLLFHKDLVQLVLDGKKSQAGALAEAMVDCYAGGAEDLEVIWIPEGSRFIINEYDGSEGIQLETSIDWEVA